MRINGKKILRFRLCFYSLSPPLFTEPEGQVDQPDHHRHFHQRTDDGGESLPGVDAEHCHRDGNGQLKIVAGSGEGEGGGSWDNPRRAFCSSRS